MARVYVDEKEVTIPLCEISTLEQVVRHVENHVLAPHSVIREIQLDGCPVVPDDSRPDKATCLSGIAERDRIEIYTGTIVDVARESICDAQSYLERAKAAIPSIALSFRASPGREEFEHLKQLYEGFYWLSRLLDRLQMVLDVKLNAIAVEDAVTRDCYDHFTSILKHMVEAQENGDLALIADLLEYEIIPMIPKWIALLEDLHEQAGRGR